MIPIENEKKIPPFLAAAARKYCESIGANEIYNVAILGEGDYRIMYYIQVDGKQKMKAQILRMPSE